jgi:tetratricopeptide (TPR) repeat protein
MKGRTGSLLVTVAALALFLMARAQTLPAAGTDPLAASAATPAPSDSQLAFEQAFIRLQQQVEAALNSIEQMRTDAEKAARKNDEAIAARLAAIEKDLTRQRDREVDSLRATHQFTLLVVGGLALLGLVGMGIMGVALLRATQRLSEASAVFAGLPGLAGPGAAGGAALPAGGSESPAHSSPLLAMINRLEKRVGRLQDAADKNGAAVRPADNGAPLPAPPEPPSEVGTLMGMGNSHLSLEQYNEALACFEGVLELDPNHVDALVKKGKALEKLLRLPEALEAYDRALAIDDTLTIAYLGKGGVFNRMERFDDALACYEKALKTQERARAEAA